MDFSLCSGDNLSKVASPPYCTRNPLVAIVGPTGAGKSEFALRIAEEFDGEIVNCDSMQIYRGFDIGTAKLSLAERRGIRHHLLDTVDPTEIFSAGDYAREARLAIEGIVGRKRVPVIVGGTGFYLRALLDGLPELPQRNDCLRRRLEGKPKLHRMLQRLDPGAAERLHPNDIVRITRALEIRLLTGAPAPMLRSGGALPGFQVRKVALLPPREELYVRLNIRTEMMFRDGLMEEVHHLLKNGTPDTAKPFEAVGYRQALAAVQGKLTLSEAIAQTQQATRNYAKRQITWFRNDLGTERILQFGNTVQDFSI